MPDEIISTKSSDDACVPPTHGADSTARRQLDQVFSLAYEELRRLAANVRRNDPNATITPTTIVNEAWIKLSRTPDVADTSLLHFKRIAGCAMRQVLVDAARRRIADSHGGGYQHISFDEALGLTGMVGSGRSTDRQVIALDAALMVLQELHPRQAALVEARFFGGLAISEVTELLGISEATALRDWRAAKAWLAIEVRKAIT